MTSSGDSGSGIRWDLDSIFPGGSTSQAFTDFRLKIQEDISHASLRFEQLPRAINDKTVADWVDYLLLVQDIVERIDQASGFVTCLTVQNINDDNATAIKNDVSALAGEWRVLLIGLEEFLGQIDDSLWAKLMGRESLVGSVFYWNELRQNAQMKMAPALEKLAAELSVNGFHSWLQIYIRIIEDLKAEFVYKGKTRFLPPERLTTLMASPDRKIRRLAFEKTVAAWQTVEPLMGMILNNLAGYRLSLYDGRGWDSPLTESLMVCRLKQESLSSMWGAVAGNMDKIKAYVTCKKELLGIKNFRWYDQMAPLGDETPIFTFEEACDFIIESLADFSPEMGDFARMAIKNRWVEAENRPGKLPLVFSARMDVKKESRIFVTFTGSYDELRTLAHELGHAYHFWVLRDRDYFARNCPPILGETASILNELIIDKAFLPDCNDDRKKLILLDRKIQTTFMLLCNIRARFLFESMFYDERRRGNVKRERLGELMIEAQRQAYGDILAPDGFHPLFWATKIHFYITDFPFYNFPYTFGLLFATGIFDRARAEGKSFASAYKALLADCGSMTAEDLARRHLGVDLTKDDFWRDAVAHATADIDTFLSLSGRITHDTREC